MPAGSSFWTLPTSCGLADSFCAIGLSCVVPVVVPPVVPPVVVPPVVVPPVVVVVEIDFGDLLFVVAVVAGACEVPCDDVVVVGADACELPCVEALVAPAVVCELLPCEIVAGLPLLPWLLPSACTAATDSATVVIAQKVIRAIRIGFPPGGPGARDVPARLFRKTRRTHGPKRQNLDFLRAFCEVAVKRHGV